MKTQGHSSTIERNKVASIVILYITAIIIVLIGASFSIYSLIYDINISVLNTQINGAIFGLIITFLGARYFLSVKKLKIQVFQESAKFSWNNFKKSKSNIK